ncbi:MAG TPA: MFS transporter [Actinomycetota bacterium]|jgi:MFS family permease|nr:MFS transporter [Actinomycetota bacterium]HNL50417.1 MFS transporter [Actinomycetota bacterium]HNO14558.1 MFS transporter [Actinomycetota bacterium]HUM85696.1 MFS transporter [Actinomycetota bacterium]
MPDPRRVVLGVSIAAGAAYLQPATLNYLVTPMLASFQAGDSAAATVRETPSVASLLVIFLAAVLAQRYGRRRVLTLGALTLALGSLLVAAAPVLAVAVAGLAVQAVGATVLLVVPLGIIGATVPGRSERARAFAIFSMVSPVVFVVLPVVTSLLMENRSWRVVAFTWAIGGLLAVLAARWALGPDGTGRTKAELLTPALAGVVCMGVAQVAAHANLSVATAVRLTITLVAAGWLFQAMRRGKPRSLDVTILRQPGFALMLIVVALWCFTQLWYYMTLAYEYVFGLSVLVAALLMVPAQLAAVVGARYAGWMVGRRGMVRTGVWFLMVTGLSLALSVLVGVDSPLWWPVLVTCLYSFASVGAGVPMTNALMDDAVADNETDASAYRQAAIGVGTAIGIAMISAVVFSAFSASLTHQLADAGLDSAPATQIAADLRSGASVQQESSQYAVPVTEVTNIDEAQKRALLDGMDAHGVVGALLSVITAGLFWWSRRASRTPAASGHPSG